MFGQRPDNYSDNDLDSLRAIVYMLRNAIAHGAMTPRWQAKGVFCRKFRINEIGYELDATRLDGHAKTVIKRRQFERNQP